MLCSWLILITAMGQTTQPAEPASVSSNTVAQASRNLVDLSADAELLAAAPASRPAGGLRPIAPPMRLGPASRPAASFAPKRADERPMTPAGGRAPAYRVSSKSAIAPPGAPAPLPAPAPVANAAAPTTRPVTAKPVVPPSPSDILKSPARPTSPMAAKPPAEPAPSLVDINDLGQLSGDPIEVHATETGDLMIVANDHDLAILSKLIAILDAQPEGAEQTVQIYQLDSAQATDVAPNIQKLWNEAKKPISGQPRPEDRLTIIPDARANLLMVATAESNLPLLEMMVHKLDVPFTLPGGAPTFTPIRLQFMKAAEAEVVVKELLKVVAAQRGVTKDLVMVKADIRSNTLLVAGPETDIELIRQLLSVVDVEPLAATGGVVKVALVPLKRAVADELADSLNEMLASPDDAAKAMKEQIRRLEVVLAETNKALPPVDLEKPIKIFSEPGTNSLIVASVEGNIPPLVEIIHELDNTPQGDDLMVKLYPLENADAEGLRESLQSIFDKSQKATDVPGKEKVKGRTSPGVTGGLSYPVSLVADKRTNTLIVSARPEQMLIVQQVIQAVDVDKSASKFPVRMIKLEHSDVTQIKKVAQELADQRLEAAEKYGDTAADRERILLIEDIRTNNLIVVAKDDNYKDIEDLAKRLDGVDDEWLGQIKILNLAQNLAASDIASKVEELWKRRAELRREGGLPEDKPVIVSDSRTNSMIVASNQEDFEAIKRLVSQLEQQKLSPMLDIYQVLIKNNDPTKMATTIKDVFEARQKNSTPPKEEEQPSERVFVTADALTRTLLIVASKRNYEDILELVNKLDVPPPVEGIIRVYYVKNIDVAKAEDTVKKLFTEGIYRGPTEDKELPESMTKVTVVSDVRSGALIVSASPENYAVIQKVLDEIDRAETPMAQSLARFFQLEHADAVNAADVLTQLLEGLGKTLKGDQADQLGFTVIPEPRANRLIMVGTKYAIQKAEELVPRLDMDVGPGGNTTTLKVRMLKEASAPQLQKVITKMIEEQNKAGTKSQRSPVSVIADETSNSLIIIASQDDHLKLEELLLVLDRRSDFAHQQLAIIPLAEAKAETLAKTLTDLMKEPMKDKEGGFSVQPEERTNSLVVWAAPDLMVNIREIVKNLDTNRPTSEKALRVFKLTNAKAEDLQKLLEDFFKSAGASTGGDSEASKQLIINFLSHVDPKTGEAVPQSLVHQDVTIKADQYTNSLLVMAPAQSIDMMQMLIEMLDRVEPQTVTVRAFYLYKSNATDMQNLLESLFKSQGTDAGTPQLTIEGTAPGAGGVMEVQFAVDERTNCLIAAGSPTQLRLVASLVEDLDSKDIEDRVGKIVRLNNAKAKDVATTLSEYFKEESDLLKDVTKQEASFRQLEREVTIKEAASETTGTTGEKARESNLLLVSCSPRMESQVYRMINELDQPIPQVMIQVLMAEIQVNDSFELGMEFALQDLAFSEQATINSNTGLPQGPGHDWTFGTDVGAAGASGLAGVSLTITGEDFNFLLRALQGEGRVEILSRPSIMVQDGQEATINIGQEVPVVDSVTITSGIAQPSVRYIDATIELTVVPVINPDGFVNMAVKPKIASVGQSSVSIGGGVTAPIINKREAETFVTIKDGETIIIGGLITTQTNDSENKVPIFGDLPLLGPLFRSTTKNTTKTELLIILTPHVLRTVEDARALSVDLRDQTGLNDNIRNSPLMQGLRPEPLTTRPSDEDTDQAVPAPVKKRGASHIQEEEEAFGPEMQDYGPEASSLRSGPAERAASVWRRE